MTDISSLGISPELALLQARVRANILEIYKDDGLKDFHVSLGPKAIDTPFDELISMQIDVIEQTRAAHREWERKTEAEKLKENLEKAVAKLRELMEITRPQETHEQWVKRLITQTPEEQALHKRLGDIWCDIDMFLCEIKDTETFKTR